ncbi:MAG: MATE family efflux transporter [Planctomycetota bacterium]|jgi:putative MATE family efflux protein
MKREATLTTAPVGRTLAALTGPMVFGHFAIVAFNFTDTYFVSRLGTRELAAMGFTFPVVMFVVTLTLGLGTGAAAVVSRAIGEGDPERVRRLTTDSLLLSLAIVFVISLVGILTIDPLFTFLGAPPDILELIRSYMRIWYVGAVFVVVPMVGNNAIRATGDTKTPAAVMMVSATVNVILDPCLIFGLGPFPRLELAGAALATVCARSISLSVALIVLHFRERMVDFARPRIAVFVESARRILYIGLPAAATNILMPLSMAVLTRLVAGFGKEAVAAISAGVRVEALAMLVMMSLSAVMVPFAGQNLGAGRIDRVRRGKNYAFAFAIFWGLVCMGGFFVTARPIARIFSRDPLVLENITDYLWIVPAGYGLGAVFRVTTMVLNGLNRPLHSLALNLTRLLVFYIPLACVGAYLFGFAGILSGIAVSNICIGLVSLLWIQYNLRALED